MSEQAAVAEQGPGAPVRGKQVMPFSMWFDVLPADDRAQVVPKWAKQLAQAHVDNDVMVLAHPDSAYARFGLICEIVTGALWPDNGWVQELKNKLGQARASNVRQIVLLLPSRTSIAYWGQWALVELAGHGYGLDNVTALLHGEENWEKALQRPDASRWLMADRFVTYGANVVAASFVDQMRAFNPMARWVHEEFSDQKVLLQPINGFHKNSPLGRIPIKNEDLSAWGADKVVYFATSNEMNRIKVVELLEQWRQIHSKNIVRLWAVIRIKDATVAVMSVHHLWVSGLVAGLPTEQFPENRFWILGDHLDAAQMQAEFEQCIA